MPGKRKSPATQRRAEDEILARVIVPPVRVNVSSPNKPSDPDGGAFFDQVFEMSVSSTHEVSERLAMIVRMFSGYHGPKITSATIFVCIRTES